MNKQYIVQESNINNRKEFYNYIINKYKLKTYTNKEYMINNKYPFVIDLNTKEFYILESITCCACAAQQDRIISIKEFKKIS